MLCELDRPVSVRPYSALVATAGVGDELTRMRTISEPFMMGETGRLCV